MHSKVQKTLRIGTIVMASFISGIIMTVMAASTFDALVQSRATAFLTKIKENAKDLTSDEAWAYYSLKKEDIKMLIYVLLEVDKGLATLTGENPLDMDPPILPPGVTRPTGTGTTGTGTSGVICTGTYPQNDPNVTLMVEGPFTIGDTSDRNNRVWKYNYNGHCTFFCKTGYTYSTTSNKCVASSTTGTGTTATGTTGTGSTTTPSNPGTTTKSPESYTPVTCSGPVPSENVIKQANKSSVFGGNVGSDWTNTTWKYDYNGSCSWICSKGYFINSTKTACEAPKPGTGVSVTVTDKNGTPIPGVDLQLGDGWYHSFGGGVTNANGSNEIFNTDGYGYETAQLILKKDGYMIFSAEGCIPRMEVSAANPQHLKLPESFCGGVSASPGTNVKVVMVSTPSNLNFFNFQITRPSYPGEGYNPGTVIGTSDAGTAHFYISDVRLHEWFVDISGVNQEDTLVCNEIISHPNYPNLVDAGKCNDPSNFKPFAPFVDPNGAGSWSWSATDGGTWHGDLKYVASIFGTPGISMKMYMKNKYTNQIASFNLVVRQ